MKFSIDFLYRQMSYWAPALVLSSWATVMLYSTLSGQINHLLAPQFRVYVEIAAFMLYGLSLLHLWLYQVLPATPPSLSPLQFFQQSARWLLLLIPVLAAALFSPNALSQTTLQNRSGDESSSSTLTALPMPTFSASEDDFYKKAKDADPHQPLQMEITDLRIIAANPEQQKNFDNRKVKVVGVYLSQNDTRVLERLMIWCCAADAQPITVPLTGTNNSFSAASKDPDNPSWVEVLGTLHFVTSNGTTQPELEVDSIKTTTEPDEPYLSP